MSDFVLAVIAFVLVLGPQVMIHEIGHYLAARFIGVTVLEFGIGIPPRAIKLFERGGTEFTLNWLPIGGFVRPLGEDFVRPVGDATVDSERVLFEKRLEARQALEGGAASAKPIKTKSLMEAGPWQRILFMVAGVLMNAIAGIALFTIAALIGQPVMQSAKMGVGSVDSGSLAATAGFLVGDVITSVNGQAVNSLDTLNAGLCRRNGDNLAVGVTRAGQDLTLNLPDPGVTGGVVLESIQAGKPAMLAGLQAKDRILKINDQAICSISDLQGYEDKVLGQAVTVTFIRSGQTAPQTLTVTLNPTMPALGASIGTVDMATVYGLSKFVAKDAVYSNQSQPFDAAVRQGLSDAWGVVQSTVDLPLSLIKGTMNIQDVRVSSVVGISQVGALVIQDSIDARQTYEIWHFAGFISIAIGIVQLLPIPGLDGGRILFVLIELLRGKPMKQEREGMIHLVGMMLLLGFMLIFVVNDLFNPINLGR